MANELAFQANLIYTDARAPAQNAISCSIPDSGISINASISGKGYIKGNFVANIAGSTGAQAIPLPSLTPFGFYPGVMWITNKDATNYVTISGVIGSGEGMVKILPGETWPFRFNHSQTPCALANTAPVEIEYTIFSD